MKYARDLGELKLIEDVVIVWHQLFYGIHRFILKKISILGLEILNSL